MTSARSFTFASSVLRWGAGLVIGLVLAAAAFELTLRAFELSPWWRVLPAVHAQFDAPDPNLGYAHRPGVRGLWIRENRAFVSINSQGLRDRERTQRPAPGTVRIAVAGDSITEAMQVDENDLFTIRAETGLSRPGHPVEVLNFGLSGALPLQQLLFISERGLPMGIDAAVFIFAISDFLNDFMRDDRVLPAYVEDSAGDLVIGYKFRNRRSQYLADRWVGRAFFWLVDHSRLIDALYIRAKLGFLNTEQAAAPRIAGDSTCSDQHSNLVALDKLWHGEPQWAARRMDKFLSDVPKYLKERPAMFILRGFSLPDGMCPTDDALRTKVVAEARKKIEAAGIAFVDLDAVTLDKMGGDSTGFQRLGGWGAKLGYGHLNSWGHQIYADVLADAVRSHFAQLLHRNQAATQ
jgi:hypothetical protein